MSRNSTASPTSFDPTAGHPGRRRVLAISCLCLVIVVIAVSSLNVAIPTMISDLQPSSTQLLWIVDAYALVFAGFLLIAGAIGDRFGRKGALLSGLTVFGLASLAASQVSDPNLLIAMRAVMGLGAAFVMPATLSIITSVFPPAERPKAIATWAGFAGAGGALGPLLGGVMVEHFGWASVFLINLPLVAIGIGLIIAIVPTSRDDEQRRLDLVGAALSVAALASLLFGVIDGPEKGWTSPIVIGAFVAAVVIGTLFVLWELRATDPMLDPRFFKVPGFRSGSLIVTSLFFGMFGMFFMISQYLQFVHGYSAIKAGFATLPSAIAMIIVAPRSPQIVGRFGTRRVTAVGMTMVSVGFFWFSTLTPTSPYWMIALGLVVIASGMGMSMAPASTAIVSSLPQNKAGVASAVNDVTREVGGALGIAVLGTILTSRYGSSMDASIPAQAPVQVREAARGSINAAMAMADILPDEFAEKIREGAKVAFTDGINAAFLTSSIFMIVMAVVVYRSVPNSTEATAH